MTIPTLNVGVIGAGSWANLCHIPCLQAHPQVHVAAICSRNRERALQAARESGIPNVFTDYRELIACGEIDAVTVAAPNRAHLPIALEAFRAGKPVFCEKPLALSRADAARMEQAARLSGKHHQVAFLFRYLHGLRMLREMAASGEIGRIFYVRVEGGASGELMPGVPFGWRHDREEAGAGMLADVGSHYIDTIRVVAGEITACCAQAVTFPRSLEAADRSLHPVTTDDIASVLFETEGGVRGQFFTGRACPQRRYAEIELYGERGGLRCPLSRGEADRMEISLRGEPYRAVSLPEGQAEEPGRCMKAMMRRFADCCLGQAAKDDQDADFTDGLRAQTAIEAALRSAEERHWVAMESG
ncbi:MAG: Gfo/Idh/MocA family oxidoreductase [Armatimonadetes bacterium]|nr:Gfo/Idh/MocA family oxidoreductase [Armatimonadota bacterium]